MSERTHRVDANAGSTAVDDSDLHRLLADDQRRAVVATLRDSRTTTRSELAAAVADHEPGRGDGVDDRIETRLHHVHLPMLEEAGVADYDPETGLVEARPSIADLHL